MRPVVLVTPKKYPEKFWHCYLSVAGRKKDRDRAVVSDMTFEQLAREIIEPFGRDVPFTVAGTIVKNRAAIEEIRIVCTPQPQSFYADRHNADMRAAGIADLATNRSLLPFGNGVDHTNELLFRDLAALAPPPDIALVVRICERLPDSARVLATRQRGKKPFLLEDEYDVQDLLHAVTRAYLKYSVREEPIGRLGGAKSSRADLAIEDLGAIIEVKFVRGPDDQTRIVEEFAQDLVHYSRWQPLKAFIYLVYNSRDLRDPEALQKLAGDHEISGKKYRTYIVLA